MPFPPTELRLSVPLDAHDASYLAASARIASLRSRCTADDERTVRIYSPAPAGAATRACKPPSLRTFEDERGLLALRGAFGGRVIGRSRVDVGRSEHDGLAVIAFA